jgi:tetratricopeptide (TPR) repeat protein
MRRRIGRATAEVDRAAPDVTATSGSTSAVEVIDADLPWERAEEGEVALTAMLESLSDQPERAAEVMTQIARARSLKGKTREAELALDRADQLLASRGNAPRATKPTLRILLERGRLDVLKKTPSSARRFFLEAFEIASTSGELFFAIDAARMMSLIETPKLRSTWTRRALDLAEGSGDARARAWLGTLYTAMAWHFFGLLQLPNAFELFEKAAAFFDAEGARRKAIVARCARARTLRAMHRVDEALEAQQKLLVDLKTHGEENGLVYEEIAECLQALRRVDEAQPYFARAYNLLTSSDANEIEASRMARLKTMAKVKT